MFKHEVNEGLIKMNPVRQIARIKPSIDSNPDHLTEEEVAVLFELTQTQRYDWLKKRDQLLFASMLYAGLRIAPEMPKCSLSQMRVRLEREILTTCKARGRKRYGTEYR